ncbi:DsrE family protein [Pelorhabdus rhamnosifermentans]|uniref:DsrE family protein n=1 Tax=Pelorhabdus rhamnosifermentans TaxID=2772457 RepID=UPI001C05F682|nr:DsrE family protein [Pelorhabdus rhamnosifermentans]
MKKLKVLLHIDDPGKWRLTLTNAKNLIEDVGLENVVLEIVANAAAVQIFDSTNKDNDQEQNDLLMQMKELSNHHVAIVGCRNALRANFISEELLPDFVTVVPAGITRIVTQQMEGYSYVKP